MCKEKELGKKTSADAFLTEVKAFIQHVSRYDIIISPLKFREGDANCKVMGPLDRKTCVLRLAVQLHGGYKFYGIRKNGDMLETNCTEYKELLKEANAKADEFPGILDARKQKTAS